MSPQRVEVTASGISLASLSFSADCAPVRVAIPPEIQLPGRALRISLRLPDAVSPKRLGLSADGRSLGIFVRWMELNYAEVREPPKS